MIESASARRRGNLEAMLETVTFVGSELHIHYPFSVNFPGSTHRLEVKLDLLPDDLLSRSRLFPLQRVVLREHESEGQPGNIDKIARVASYTPKNGGWLEIYLGNIWQIAEAYNEGVHNVRRGWLVKKESPRWWLGWVDNIAEMTGKGSSRGDLVNVKLWEWLVSSTLVKHAALTRLSLNQAAFKKFIDDAGALTGLVAWVGGTFLFEWVLDNPLLGVSFLYSDIFSGRLIGGMLRNRIEMIEEEILDKITPHGPLVRLT